MRGRCAAKLTHLAVNPTPPPPPTAPPPCPTHLRGAAEMPPRAPSVPRVPRPQPTPAQAVWSLAWPRSAAAPTLQFPPYRPPSPFLAGKKDRRWADGWGAPVSAPRSSPVQLTTQNWGHLGGPGRPPDWLVSGGRCARCGAGLRRSARHGAARPACCRTPTCPAGGVCRPHPLADGWCWGGGPLGRPTSLRRTGAPTTYLGWAGCGWCGARGFLAARHSSWRLVDQARCAWRARVPPIQHNSPPGRHNPTPLPQHTNTTAGVCVLGTPPHPTGGTGAQSVGGLSPVTGPPVGRLAARTPRLKDRTRETVPSDQNRYCARYLNILPKR